MKKSLTATLIASAITAFAPAINAAGLGAINVMSGLGQPLRAEIELQATSQELTSLSARVPSPDVFQQANVSYSPLMTGIRINVEQRGNRPVLRLTSDRPVNEPFLDLLVELNWASGRLLREYTFLLDPIDRPQPASTAGMVQAPRSQAPAAAPAPAAPASPPPAVSAPRAADYTVRRGDTLRAIADRFRPQGVSLDQMLVALLRQNPQAFDGGNMNRLQAGAILNIPDATQAREVDAGAARREIVAQAADFEAYRQRLAGVAATRAETQQEASREQRGAITPRVESAEPVAEAADQVRVSGADGEATDPDRVSRLQALEEELVARDQALEETNSRLAELEQSIRDLQRLIEMRNESLALLQQQLAAQGGEPVPLARAESEAPATGAAEPAAPAPRPAPQAAPAARPPAQDFAPQPSLVDSMLADRTVLMGGGGILALLLGYTAYRLRARRRAEEEAGAFVTDDFEPNPETRSVIGGSGGESVDTGDTSMLESEFSQSGMSAIDSDEGVDPVAEADVYMAYGRDAQAEEILLDALKADPTRSAIYLKLLELYAQRGDARQFEVVATDFYSRTSGEGEEWARAAAMGRQIDPENPLYREGRGDDAGDTPTRMGDAFRDAAVVAGAAALAAGVAHDSVQDEAATDDVEASDDNAFADLEFRLDDAATSEPAEADDFERSFAVDEPLDEAPAADAGADQGDDAAMSFAPLDFDLDKGPGAEPPTRDTAETAPEESAPDDEPQDALEGDQALSFDLDLDLEQSAAPAAQAEEIDELQKMADALAAGQPGDDEDVFAAFGDIGPDEEESSDGARDAAGLDETVIAPPGMLTDDEHSVMDLEQTEFDERLLDFDLDLAEPEERAPEPGAAPAFDLSEINLDLEESADTDEASAAEPAAAAAEPDDDVAGQQPEDALSDEAQQEVETKLELARAYEEMGDAEGARELVEEVMREGSASQRDAAQALLERLQ